MNRALAPLVTAALLALALPARADVSPTCGDFDTLVNCASADEGKTCPTGGICKSIPCVGGSVQKCYACPIAIADPAMICQGGGDYGKSCGGGETGTGGAGTCNRIPSWCAGAGYSVCSMPTTAGMMEAGVADTATSNDDSGVIDEDAGIIIIDEDAGPTSDGGPTGSTSSGGSSFGCSLGAAGSQAALAGLMMTVGAAALLFDRRRSKSRKP